MKEKPIIFTKGPSKPDQTDEHQDGDLLNIEIQELEGLRDSNDFGKPAKPSDTPVGDIARSTLRDNDPQAQ